MLLLSVMGCVGVSALLCFSVCVYIYIFFHLKFNSHCLTFSWCLRKSSVREAREVCGEGLCLCSMYVCVRLCGSLSWHFLFALIPPVALAIRSLSAISPLPYSEGKDRAKIPYVLNITLDFLVLSCLFFSCLLSPIFLFLYLLSMTLLSSLFSFSAHFTLLYVFSSLLFSSPFLLFLWIEIVLGPRTAAFSSLEVSEKHRCTDFIISEWCHSQK